MPIKYSYQVKLSAISFNTRQLQAIALPGGVNLTHLNPYKTTWY